MVIPEDSDMLTGLILATSLCRGGTCTVEKPVVSKEVTKHKVVQVLNEREVQPVRKAVLRVRDRHLLRRR